MSYLFSLNGQVAAVTGATRGIGHSMESVSLKREQILHYYNATHLM